MFPSAIGFPRAKLSFSGIPLRSLETRLTCNFGKDLIIGSRPDDLILIDLAGWEYTDSFLFTLPVEVVPTELTDFPILLSVSESSGSNSYDCTDLFDKLTQNDKVLFYDNFRNAGCNWTDTVGTPDYDSGIMNHTADGDISITNSTFQCDNCRITFKYTQNGTSTNSDQLYIAPIRLYGISYLDIYHRTYSTGDYHARLRNEGTTLRNDVSYNYHTEALASSWFQVVIEITRSIVKFKIWKIGDTPKTLWDWQGLVTGLPTEANFEVRTVGTGGTGVGFSDLLIEDLSNDILGKIAVEHVETATQCYVEQGLIMESSDPVTSLYNARRLFGTGISTTEQGLTDYGTPVLSDGYVTLDGTNGFNLSTGNLGLTSTEVGFIRVRIHNKDKGTSQLIWKDGGATNGITFGIDPTGNLGIFGASSGVLAEQIFLPSSSYSNNVWYDIYLTRTRLTIIDTATQILIGTQTGNLLFSGNGTGLETIGYCDVGSPITLDSTGDNEFFEGDIECIYIHTEGQLQAPTRSLGNSKVLNIWAKVPTIYQDKDTLLRLYYDPDHVVNKDYVGSIYEPVIDLVVPRGSEGTYDTTHTYSPCVIKESDTSYKMWYSGYDGTNARILYCTSVDGINWTGHQLVVDLLNEGTYDTDHVRDPLIIKESDTSYKMWYTGYSDAYRILYCTSVDGINWTGHQLVVDLLDEGTYDTDHAFTPSVIKESDISYKMWYSGRDATVWRILYCTSTDGITWSNHQLVVDILDEGTYDTVYSYSPNVIKESDTSYKMWYIGQDDTNDRILYCTSVDGINWTGHQLVVDIDNTGFLDTANSYYPAVIRTLKVGPYELWYSAHDGTNINIVHSYLYNNQLTNIAGTVWSNQFEAVYHLEQLPTDQILILDSTSTSPGNAVDLVYSDSRLDNHNRSILFDGVDSQINLPAIYTSDSQTLEAFFHLEEDNTANTDTTILSNLQDTEISGVLGFDDNRAYHGIYDVVWYRTSLSPALYGYDWSRIQIKDSLGNSLFTEVEYWNPSTKQAVLHIKVPTVSASSDTVLSLNYDPTNSPLPAIEDSLVLLLQSDTFRQDTTFIDNSLSSHTVTPNGTPIHSTDKSKFGDSAMYFNGTTDYLSFSTHTDFQLGTGDFTISLWFNTLNAVNDDNARRLISMDANTANVIQLYVSDAGTIIFLTDAIQLTANIAPDDGLWHHVALVRLNGTTTLYIDGSNEDSMADSTSYTCGATWYIGRMVGASGYFDGYMDEFQIHKGVALYTTDFTPPTKATSLVFSGETGSVAAQNVWDNNFVSVYHMVEDNGYLEDSTGNSLHLSLDGGTKIAGLLSSAMDFDGISDYSNITSGKFDIITGGLTYEAVIRRVTQTASLSSIMTKGQTGANLGAFLGIPASSDTIQFGTTTDYISGGDISTSTFTSIAGTWDGSTTLALYSDGIAISTTPTGTFTGFSSTSEDFTLAAQIDDSVTGSFLDGTLDEVRISDVERSADWELLTDKSNTDALITYEDTVISTTASTLDGWDSDKRIRISLPKQDEIVNDFPVVVNLTKNGSGINDFDCGTFFDELLPHVDGDDFTGEDGDPPNELLWVIDNKSASGTALINNNKYRITIPLTSADEQISSYNATRITGDFDMQIDYSEILNDPPSSSYSYIIGFYIHFVNGKAMNLYINIDSAGNKFIAKGDSDNGNVSISYALTEGKLRYRRVGSVVTVWYWSGSQWEWNGNTSGSDLILEESADIKILRFKVSADFDSGVTTDLDNFKINSGTVIWPNVSKRFAIQHVNSTAQCNVEIESVKNDAVVLHVNVPSLSTTEDTILDLYFDKDHEENTAYVGNTGDLAAQQVWDNNFVFVSHQAQDPSGSAPQILDSTSNEMNGTSYGTMTSEDLIDADIGKAIEYDGTDDYTNHGYNAVHDITDTLTLEISLMPNVIIDNSYNKYVGLISRSNDPDPAEDTYALMFNNSGNCYLSSSGGANIGTKDSWAADQNFIIASTYNATGLVGDLFVDGEKEVTTNTLNTMSGSVNSLVIGKSLAVTNFADMAIGEVRISNIVRSDTWIALTNESLKDTLLSYASVDNLPGWNEENKIQLRIPAYKVNETLTDFPLLINLSENNRPDSVDDDFTGEDGDPPNDLFWKDHYTFGTNITSSTAEIEGNSLRVGIANDGTDNISRYSVLKSLFKLSGDLDIQVDISEYAYTGTDDKQMVYLSYVSTGDFIGFRESNEFRSLIGSSSVIVSTRSNVYGKLRLTRVGTITTAFVQDGTGDWEQIASGVAAAGADDVNICIVAYGYDNNTTVTALMGNFKLNSGTIVWPNSATKGLGSNRYNPTKFFEEFHNTGNDEYTKLLIQAPGKSGSTTFTDESSSDHPVTAHGDAKVKDFNANDNKIVNHSGFFNGTDGYLTIPDSADFSFGTGNFTIEFFINFSSVVGYQDIYIQNKSGGIQLFLILGSIRYNNAYVAGILDTTTSFVTGRWYHVALVRDSGVAEWFVDGVSESTVASTHNWTSTTVSEVSSSAQPFSGYLAGYAVHKAAIYTENFITPKTIAEMTNDSNTVLFLDFTDLDQGDTPATITDTSASAHTVTNVSSKVSGCSFHWQGAIEFDGTEDYLTIPDSGDFETGSEDFTVDLWINFFSFNTIGIDTIYWKGGDSNNGLQIDYNNSTNELRLIPYQSSSAVLTCVESWTPSINSWYHIAAVRNDTLLELFVDGISIGSGAISGAVDTTAGFYSYIGVRAYPTDREFNGFIAEPRISKGIARYTADFTPPSEPFGINDAKRISVENANTGEQLYVEIENYDYDRKSCQLHAKVPELSSTYDTILNLYFDKHHARNEMYVGEITSLAGQNVWDENFVFVSHQAKEPAGEIAANTVLYAAEVSATGSAGNVASAEQVFTPVDVTGLSKSNGMLKIDLKVSNIDYCDFSRNSQIEITSAGTSDSEEWNYNLLQHPLTVISGLSDYYKTFYLPLSESVTTGGELDVSAIDYIEWHVFAKIGSLTTYWKNAEIVPLAALDSTSHSAHGSSYGSMTSGDLIDGTTGKALDYDGVDDYTNHGYNAAHDITDTLTLEASFTPSILLNDTTGYLGIASRRDDPTDSEDTYGFIVNVDGKLSLTTTGGNIQGTKTSWTADQNFIVAGTYNATGLVGDLFVDGVKETLSNDAYDTLAGSTNNLVIGKLADTDDFFPGSIQEVRISNIVRSDDWITSTNDSLSDDLIIASNAAVSLQKDKTIPLVIPKEVTDTTLTDFPVLLNLSQQSGDVNYNFSDVFETLYPEVTGDDFTGEDGDAPNKLLWNITNSSVSGTVALLDNKLRVSIPFTSANESISSISVFRIDGDFDVQVDYDQISNDPPSSSTSHLAGFFIHDGTRSFPLSSAVNSTPTRSFYSGSPADGSSFITTALTEGKLRWTRAGTTVTCYYWNGSQWEWDGNTSGRVFSDTSTGSIAVNILTGADFDSGTTTEYDNFIINSGTVIWPDTTDNWKYINITDASNNSLFTEIEHWDTINQKAVLHVKVPEISPTFDTLLTFDYNPEDEDNSIGDDFTGTNGDAPNPSLWEVSYNGSDGTGEISGNKFRADITNTSSDNWVNVRSKFELSGDFDIQIDFDEVSVDTPSSSDSYPSVFKVVYGSNYMRICHIHYSTGNNSGNVRSPVDNISINNAYVATGKYRISRISGSVTVWYWSGSQWEWNGNTSGHTFSDANTENVRVSWESSADFNAGSTVDFDNFIINSADSIIGLIGESGSIAGQQVWDDNFVFVSHQAQDPSGGANCILDSTSNANHGTPYGTMTSGDLIDAEVGKALDYDGTDDSVKLPDALDDPLATGSFTVTCLSQEANGVVVSRGYAEVAGDPHGIALSMYPTSMQLVRNVGDTNYHIFNSGALTDYGPKVLGEFTFDYDTGDAEMFAHGVSVATETMTTGDVPYEVTRDEGYHIGAMLRVVSPVYYDETISEVRISNIVRSDDWISATNLSLTDTLFNFPLTAIDTDSEELPPYTFNLTIDKNLISSNLTDFPVTLKLNGSSGLTNKNTSAIFDELINYSNINTRWNYLASTYDKVTQSLYLNDISYSKAETLDIPIGGAAWYIGGNWNNTDWWSGVLSEIRISSTPRTADWLKLTHQSLSDSIFEVSYVTPTVEYIPSTPNPITYQDTNGFIYTIDSTNIASDLTDFPVVITLQAANDRPDNVDDDFTGDDGDPPNELLWDNSNTTGAILSNKLRIDCTNRSSQTQSLFYLTGDFDIQVDFDSIVFDTPGVGLYTYAVQLQLRPIGLSIYIYKDSNGNAYIAVYCPSTDNSQFSSSISSGKLRITRNGSTYTAYLWSGSQWDWNGNTSGYTFTFSSTEAVYCSLNLISPEAGVTSTTDYDNFIVNSGTIGWPNSHTKGTGITNFDTTAIFDELTGGKDQYTKLLIHTDTEYTSTYVSDSSDSSHLITTVGDTRVKDFGADGNSIVNYSGFFNGTDSYLTVPDHADWPDDATDVFTIEAWIFPTNTAGTTEDCIYAQSDGTSNNYTTIYLHNGSRATKPGAVAFAWMTGGSTDASITSPDNAIAFNAWNHIAIVRNGASFAEMFINGISVGTTTNTVTTRSLTTAVYIGRASWWDGNYFMGYISELVIHSTNIYTTAFTPPKTIAEMTNDENTVLFLDFNNASQGITFDSDATDIAMFKTCDQSSVYNVDNVAGRAVDNSSSLSHTNSSSSEWWKIDLGREVTITEIFLHKQVGFGDRPNDYYIQTADDWAFTSNVTNIITASNENSEEITYLVADFGNVKTRYIRVQCYSSSQYIVFHDVNIKTSDFMYPLLDNSASAHTVTNVSSNVSGCTFWWDGAIEFNGTTDYLTVPDSDDWDFTSGDYTVDFWCKIDTLPAASGAYTFFTHFETVSLNQIGYLYNVAGTYYMYWQVSDSGNTVNFNEVIVPVAGKVYHFAFVRENDDWKVFVDGTQLGSTLNDTSDIPSITGLFKIGSYDNNLELLGQIAELRISKGIARWTTAFTPPTKPYRGSWERIKITDASDTILYTEVENWDLDNKKATLHVKIPTVSSSEDTVLTLDYNDTNADNSLYINTTDAEANIEGTPVTIFTQSLSISNNFNSSYTIRTVIDSSRIASTVDGIMVLKFGAVSSPNGFSSCYIGNAASSGDSYDFETTPTQVTFNGGSASVSLSATLPTYSDSIVCNLDSTKNVVVSFKLNTLGYVPRESGSGLHSWTKAADDAATVNATGYADGGALVYGVEEIIATPLTAPARLVWDTDTLSVFHQAQDPSGTAPQILDSTSNANHATTSGTMTSSDLVDGITGKSLDLDGLDDHIDLDSTILVTNDSTTSFYIKSSLSVTQQLMSNDTSVSNGRVSISPTTFTLWFDNGAGLFTNMAHGGNLGDGVHLTLTRSGSTCKIYTDGILADTTTELTTTDSFQIDCIGGGGGAHFATAWVYVDGTINEVRFENGIRSDSWIETTYKSFSDTLFTTTQQQAPVPMEIGGFTATLAASAVESDLIDFPVILNLGSTSGITNLDTTIIFDELSGRGIDDYTKLMIHADNIGTNFLDSSRSRHMVTTVGDTKVKDFNADGNSIVNYSGYFNGTDAYLTIPDSTDFNLSDTFSISCTVFVNSINAMNLIGSYVDDNNRWLLFIHNTGRVQYSVISGGSVNYVYTDGLLQAEKFYHITYSQSGSTAYISINGIIQSLTYNGVVADITSLTDGIVIGSRYVSATWGYYLDGYLAQVSIDTTVLYTTDFTPPLTIAEMTNDANTVLFLDFTDLTQGETPATITDTSASAHTVTNILTNVSGCTFWWDGAIEFDGTGDYLSLAESGDFDISSDDFTIDFWFSISDISKTTTIVSFGTANYRAVSIGYVNTGNRLQLVASTNTSSWTTLAYGDTPLEQDRLYHVAFVFDNDSEARVYLDGKLDLTDPVAPSQYFIDNDICKIGAHYSLNALYYFEGSLSEFRISKGIARYTTDFTPPTSKYLGDWEHLKVTDIFGNLLYTEIENWDSINKRATLHVKVPIISSDIDTLLKIDYDLDDASNAFDLKDKFTKLLIHADGEDASTVFTDSSDSSHSITTEGDTKTKDFNADGNTIVNHSGFFNGTDAYLTVPDHADWNTGAGDFTLEGWVLLTNAGSDGDRHPIFAQQSHGTTSVKNSLVIANDTGVLTCAGATRNTGTLSLGSCSGTTSLELNTWYHLAYVRHGNDFYVYVNGVQDGTVTQVGTANDGTGSLCVGGYDQIAVWKTYGYIAVAAYHNGIALYPSGTTFTPPTTIAEMTNDSNTKLFLDFTELDQGETPATINDSSASNHTVTNVSTNVSGCTFWWDGAIEFDGTGDYLTVPNSEDFDIGSGDFTLDFWVCISTTSTAIDFFRLPDQSIVLYYYTSQNTFNLAIDATPYGSTNNNFYPVLNAWHHIAVTKEGSMWLFFKDGVQTNTCTYATVPASSDLLEIMGSRAGRGLIGLMSGFRFSKGIARWTSAFTPPTQPQGDGHIGKINTLTSQSVWDDNFVFVSHQAQDPNPIIGASTSVLRSAEVSNTHASLPQAATSFTPVNVPGLTKANGVLKIDLKVDVPGNINWGSISELEITSSGSGNTEEWQYLMHTDPAGIRGALTTTYETFYIPLSYFNSVGGELDVTQIDYIRWYCYVTSSTTIYWQNAEILITYPQILDSTSYGMHGKSYGTMLTEDLIDGVTGKMINYDGTDDYTNHGYDAAHDITDTLTLEASFTPNTLLDSSITDSAGVLSRENDPTGSEDTYSLYVNPGGLLKLASSGGNITSTKASWAAEQNFIVAGTYGTVEPSAEAPTFVAKSTVDSSLNPIVLTHTPGSRATGIIVSVIGQLTGRVRSGGLGTVDGVPLTDSGQGVIQYGETSMEVMYIVGEFDGSQVTISLPNSFPYSLSVEVISFCAGDGASSIFDVSNSASGIATSPGYRYSTSLTTTTDNTFIFTGMGTGYNFGGGNFTQDHIEVYQVDSGNQGRCSQYLIKADPGSQDMGWVKNVLEDYTVIAIAFRAERLSGNLFVDGVKETLSADTYDTMAGSTNNLVIGKHSDTLNFFPGSIGEVRISNIVRTDNWIVTTNLSLTDSLFTITKTTIIE